MTIYVNMLDRALSGWGGAPGKSLYCVKCETRAQADAIEQAARNRSEMKYIALSDKPRRGGPRDNVMITTFDELGEKWKKFYRGE